MNKSIATILTIALCVPLLSFAQNTETSAVSAATVQPTPTNKGVMNKLRDKVNQIKDKNIAKSADLTTVQLSCLKIATTKREDSVISAMNAFHTAMISAMNTRKTSLESLWTLPKASDRKIAREKLHTVYRESINTAHKNLKNARDGAWTSFKADAKACGVSNTDEIKSEKPEDSTAPTLGL